jgi:hypothetical protein
MLLRAVSLLLIAGFFLATLSCNLFAPSSADIQAAFDAYTAGIASAVDESTPNTTTEIESSPDGSVVGTYDLSDASDVTASYRFSSYLDPDSGYTIDGTVTWSLTGYGSASSTASESGTLSYSGGPVTSLDMDVTATIADSGTTYGGYVTANGIERWDASSS